MRRFLPVLGLCSLLTGCTVVEGPAYPPIGLAPDSYRPPVTRGCENYADQTARNTYENLSDPEDSFGADAFNQRRAEDAGDRAYERCRQGRLN